MRSSVSLTLALFLVGCGGGSSSTSSPVTLPPTKNTPPQISSGGTVTIAENTTAVTAVQASDADGDNLTYSILGGEDSLSFSINGSGALAFRTAPDFELAEDSDRNNSYLVIVSVSDGKTTDTANFVVRVENDREGISVRRLATGFDDIRAIASIPNSDDIYVAERGGQVTIVNPVNGSQNLDRTILNVNTTGEGGLLGLVADPDDSNVYWAFVTAARTGFFGTSGSNITIRRIRRNQIETPMGSGIVLEIPHDSDVNYGGAMMFDGIDRLSIAVGDAGQPSNAQDPNSKLGKILQVVRNPDPFAGASPTYLLPSPSNPFLGGGGDPFVYALGVRNPSGLSDATIGMLFGDRGEAVSEEINYILRDGGSNLGWPFYEGTSEVMTGAAEALTVPVTAYGRGNDVRKGGSIVSGVYYRGAIGSLSKRYIFADSISGNIWALRESSLVALATVDSDRFELMNTDFTPDVGSIDAITAFGTDAAGNLYIADSDGELFIVEPV